MFVILLKFSINKNQATDHMDGHNQWIKQGFDEGVFLLVGSLEPNRGGAVIAHNTSLPELRERVSHDPFVSKDVVTVEILEIDPKNADERLSFLIG